MASASHGSAPHHLTAEPVMTALRYPAVLQCWSEQCPTDRSPHRFQPIQGPLECTFAVRRLLLRPALVWDSG